MTDPSPEQYTEKPCLVPEAKITLETDPFRRPNVGLFVTAGVLNRLKARILFDPGSDICHIGEYFCSQNNFRTKYSSHNSTMVNKTTQTLRPPKCLVEVQIKGYTENLSFTGSPLNHDLILGKNWCVDHHMKMDMTTDEISFFHGDKNIHFVAKEFQKRHVVSCNTMLSEFKSNHPVFEVVLRQLENSNLANECPEEIQRVLDKFQQVFFPEKLPLGLSS